ncbi:hypothetical protein D3C73_1188090 [compost metagenome]
MCFVDQQGFGRNVELALQIVTETIGNRLHRFEGVDVGLFLRGIHTARSEGHAYRMTGVGCRLFDRRGTGQHD